MKSKIIAKYNWYLQITTDEIWLREQSKPSRTISNQ
jgi:hypothetical protein